MENFYEKYLYKFAINPVSTNLCLCSLNFKKLGCVEVRCPSQRTYKFVDQIFCLYKGYHLNELVTTPSTNLRTPQIRFSDKSKSLESSVCLCLIPCQLYFCITPYFSKYMNHIISTLKITKVRVYQSLQNFDLTGT